MKDYFRLILVLVLPLAMVVAYSLGGYTLVLSGWSVSKAKMPAAVLDSLRCVCVRLCVSDEKVLVDTLRTDSLAQDTCILYQGAVQQDSMALDTMPQRILFFGDSMVEGLALRFSDYAAENGHQLYSVCWYGSTIAAWATAPDSIENMLAWARPHLVVVSLGGNELRATDLDWRRENIRKIEGMLAPRPTMWIAPPSWVKHPTITGAILDVVGEKRYFDSTRLRYTRSSDNMHPTFGSSARWMDSIAVWMSSPQCIHPIRMDVPQRKYPRRWNKRFVFPKH